MTKKEWNLFDKILYKVLNYVVGFGWIIPIWSSIYKLELFLTWIGCLFLGLIMAYNKKNTKGSDGE